MRLRRGLDALAGLCLALGARAGAQPEAPAGIAESLVTTRHWITAGGRRLSYTARAGFLPIRTNATGEMRAWVFFVAYTLDRPPGAPVRPLTFAWNGGPGSNSLLLHLSAIGPRRLVGLASDRSGIADNADTWLDRTDLVFIDPVGTGFSRPLRAADAQAFYSVLGDIAATVEIIRVYRTVFDAWDAPVYLAGESYGVWRAAGVAEAMERAGSRVAGAILISGGIPLGPVVPDEVKTALFLPTRTAAAWHHRLLDPALQRDRAGALAESERWAREVYAPALARVNHLSSALRDSIVRGLARFTGLRPSRVDRRTLVVDRQLLLDHLLEGRGAGPLGRFDTRTVGAGEVSAGPNRDREANRRATIDRYLRRELGVRTDLAYQGLDAGWSAGPETSVNARWEYDQGEPNAAATARNTDGPPGGTPPWLARTLSLDARMRAFVAAGWYDSLNSCVGNAEAVHRLPPVLGSRITVRCYEGGHMMYEDADARAALHRDVGVFFDGRTQAAEHGERR